MTITGGTLWGVSGVCGQFLFQNKDVTASWLVPVRLMMAGIFMLCFYIWKDKKKAFAIWQKKENRWGILIYGLAGMMLCQYSYFQTIEWSNAGTATVIQYLGPALIVVWVCLQTRRLPERKEIIGVLLALLGIFLIATHGNPTSLALSGRALLMGLDFSRFSRYLYCTAGEIAETVSHTVDSGLGYADRRLCADSAVSALASDGYCRCTDEQHFLLSFYWELWQVFPCI